MIEPHVEEVRRELDAKIDHLRDEMGRAVTQAVAPLSLKLDGLAAEFVRMRQDAIACLDRRVALAEARLDGEVQLCRECKTERDHRFEDHERKYGDKVGKLSARLDAVEKEQIKHNVYWRIVQVAQALITSGVGLYFIQAALRHIFG